MLRPQHSHHLSADAGGGGTPGPRLNLLLSYAGWRSDPWVDRLPRLLEPMGVMSHRAASGREASDVIRTTRIHVAVVDLALPLDLLQSTSRASELDAPEFTEGGTRLLEILARLAEPPPVVAVKRQRTTRDDARDLSDALRLGAFAVVDRPHQASDLDVILGVIRRILERHYEGRWPTQ
ncbi:MAG: hypothetical protein U0637_03855 [Phycisphaerales bacterium]